MRGLLYALAICLYATTAQAQSDPVNYELNVYATGASIPATRVVPASAVFCDRPMPALNSMNPNKWGWPDPAHIGRVCEIDDAPRLAALPDGNYAGSITDVYPDGTRGPESLKIPFTVDWGRGTTCRFGASPYRVGDLVPVESAKQQLSTKQAQLRAGGFTIVDVRRLQGNRYEILARCVGL